MNIFNDEDENLTSDAQEAEKDDLDRFSSLQNDKIFNNSYESTEYDTGKISFNVAPQYSGTSTSPEDRIELDMAWTVVSEILDHSKFKNLNRADKEGNYKKLNKLQINEVYSFIVMQLPEFPRIQLFSVVQEYFDVNSNKFYDSLSNTFKKELIEELRKVGYMREKTGGPLF